MLNGIDPNFIVIIVGLVIIYCGAQSFHSSGYERHREQAEDGAIVMGPVSRRRDTRAMVLLHVGLLVFAVGVIRLWGG